MAETELSDGMGSKKPPADKPRWNQDDYHKEFAGQLKAQIEQAVALLKRRRKAKELILGVWLQGGAYAARHLTDGHLPRPVVERYPRDIVRVLIEVGLWSEIDTGFQIHDYLHYNPSAVTVLRKREKSRIRQDAHRNRNNVTPLLTRDTERDKGNVTALVTRTSRARGTRPHPVQQVRTHTGSRSTSADERQACVWWHDLWLERWPEGIPQMPHARALELERLEQQLGIDDLTNRISQYLADPSDWLIQHKHPVATFITRINSYEAQPPPARPTSRIRNCPQCHADERGHDDTCDHCDWTREAWDARK